MTKLFETVNAPVYYHVIIQSYRTRRTRDFLPSFLAKKPHCASTSDNYTCLHYSDKWYDPMLTRRLSLAHARRPNGITIRNSARQATFDTCEGSEGLNA